MATATKKNNLLRRYITNQILWFVVVLAFVLIGLCTAWDVGFESHSTAALFAFWGLFMLRTFSFHLGLAFYPLLGIALLRRDRRLILATALLVGLHVSWWLPAYVPRDLPPIQGQAVRVMSVNLLANNGEHETVFAEIGAADPDILLIQEYAVPWDRVFYEHFSTRYPHIVRHPRFGAFGMAIYSKLPFVGEPNSFVKIGTQGFPQIRAVVRIDDRPVALYNLHYLPPSHQDYVAEDRHMFADMMERLAEDPLPKFLGGDFNFTDMSVYHQRLLKAGFTDPHEVAGLGRASTWRNRGFTRHLPGFRLDHFYLSPELTAADARVGIGNSSDHKPILATIGIAGNDE